MNKVCLTGRLTSTPQLRYTTSNTEVCNFALAVNRKFKNQNGDYEADFINCVAYKSTAKLLADYVEKGDLIGVEGRIQTRTYKDKNDATRYVTEVIVESIDFLSSKKKNDDNKPSNLHIEENELLDKDPFADFGEQVTLDDDFLD